MPVIRLAGVNMTIKFEWQFKYRDESNVNTGARRDPTNPKKRRFAKG
jgi:hypothetical protein